MSPLTAVLCIALVSFAAGGYLPSTRRSTDYQLAVNYHNQKAEDSASIVVNQRNSPVAHDEKAQETPVDNTNSAKPKEGDKSSDEPAPKQEITSEAAPTEVTSTTEISQPQQSPLSQVSSGALSYAYHGQSQQSSQVSQTLAYSGADSELTHHHQYSELPGPASVTYYHPEGLHTGDVVAVARNHFPTAYLQPERPRVLTAHSAILTPGAVTTYQAGPATITHLHPVPVQPRPVSEQAFSVNVASAKYGYGYTVRGIQHAH